MGTSGVIWLKEVAVPFMRTRIARKPFLARIVRPIGKHEISRLFRIRVAVKKC
jgi:hypothetical protein